MTCELTITVTTVRRQGAHGTFETIKDMFFATQSDFKALTLVIPTNFTTYISLDAFDSTHKSPLYLLDLPSAA